MGQPDGKTALRRFISLTLFGCVVLAGCDSKHSDDARNAEYAPAPSMAAPISGEMAKAGAMLAYEHQLDLKLPPALIAPHVTAVREACETAKFGACNVLNIDQDSTSAELVLRAAPAAIEPLVALAAKDGEMGRRVTSAEDLADAVADNSKRQQRLLSQQRRLDELAARQDISVTDLITLSGEQANIENELQSLAQAAAQNQRRLDTNRLTLRFTASGTAVRTSHLSDAFTGLLDKLIAGIADAVGGLSYALPFIILAFPVLLLWVWLWRRFIRRRG